MLYGAEAASLATLGDGPAAKATLGAARDDFGRINATREPEWMRFYDQGELLAQYGRVYRDFAREDGKHGRTAVQWVIEALPAYSPQNVRSTVLSEVSLCSALFLAEEPEEGLAIGRRAIERAKGLSSPRILDRIHNVRRDLVRHKALPDVAAFAHDLAAIGPATR